MSGYFEVARLGELHEGTVSRLALGATRVAVVRVGDEVFAVADTCTHLAVSLSRGGLVEDCALTCWLHGSRFDLRTGRPENPPATGALAVYDVQIETDDAGEAVVFIAAQPRGPLTTTDV